MAIKSEDIIRIARGDAPADILFKNANLVNVYSSEVYVTDVAVANGLIVAIGTGYTAKETIDLNGRYLCSGFIDAHVHIESSLLPPREFAKVVVPHGVTTTISDPHEIANVLGPDGIRYMLQQAEHGSFSMLVDAPSCVPSTVMETSGSHLPVSRSCLFAHQDFAPKFKTQ